MAADEHVDPSPTSSASVEIVATSSIDHAIPLPPLPSPLDHAQPQAAPGTYRIVVDSLLYLILLALALFILEALLPLHWATSQDLFPGWRAAG